ncbi:DUF4956 domain-containing protein [Planctomicrobium sp. SH661]|uniref:DUF4956 domain-containing protein n=1 Tax=Planctomicrobium sp. SH661 TaxID=3448124 RepID=UPI003F5BCC76
MPDWLTSPIAGETSLSLPLLVLRLGLGLVFGILVAGSYRITQGRLSTRSLSLMATLVLLTILIAMVTLAIGNSVARAFSLVGALSIVRFRTVVEDTRDTAFVIFAVAIGMAVGAGYFEMAIVGIPVTTLAAYLFRPRQNVSPEENLDRTLNIRIGLGRDVNAVLEPTFRSHLERWELNSIATAKQGAALDLSYHTRLLNADAALPLTVQLNQLEGVQEVELRC